MLPSTSDGGHILVETHRVDGHVQLRVKDTGLGMSEETRRRIFDLFSQEGRALDRSQGGLGIGLTLAKKLIELHGGTIEAESEGEGHGSVFTITLKAIEPPKDKHAGKREAKSLEPKRILIVDDNEDAASALAMLLELDGHSTTVVNDGLAALEIAPRLLPDVALLDIGLPGMDGIELVGKLRQIADLNPLYVAISGYGQPEDVLRAKQAGFHHHLVKPIEQHQLLNLLFEHQEGTAENHPR